VLRIDKGLGMMDAQFAERHLSSNSFETVSCDHNPVLENVSLYSTAEERPQRFEL
jgi:hypothetical protein